MNFVNKRSTLSLDKIDFLKVFMMFVVVFGHCIALWLPDGWFNQSPKIPSPFLSYLIGWINTFHIYAFTFASGYLFYYVKYERGGYDNYFTAIKGRVKRLLVPYAVVSLVWAIPVFVLFNGFNAKELVKRFLFATNPEQLWFLIMLFVVFCIFLIASNAIEKMSAPNIIACCVIIYIIGVWIGPKVLPNIFQIWTSFRYVIFFYLGYRYRKGINIHFNPIVMITLSLGIYTLYYWLLKTDQSIHLQRISLFFSCVIGCLSAVECVRSLSDGFIKSIVDTPVYKFFKMHNMTIYLIHQQIIYFVVNALNGKTTNTLMVVLSFFAGIGISSVFAIIISKFSVTRKIFGYEKY